MWQILLSLFASTEKLVPLGRLHTHEVQHCISRHWDFDALTSNLWIPLSPPAEEDLQWWKSAHNVLRGAPVTPTKKTRHPVVHRCIEHRLGSTLECIDGVRCMDNNNTRVRSHTQTTPL
ncbi:hypothetical protein NP493_1552g00011 [Ridgeia piscesae]|uniref:Uncharacterized protein n=1 Tax=Ridgeia piscesae TaxID=27915 RepID=A0AAD9JZJ3_RIDPI|nr:hypothetical protein NP493_1552g00011 [Ridgeia piscesae]